jgi:hypothetical protein
MRQIVFAPYAEAEGVSAKSVQLWALFWQSLYNPNWNLGPDKSKARAFAKLLDLADEIVTKKAGPVPGSAQTSLKTDGGALVLSDEQYELVKEAWNAFYPNLPKSLAREVVAYDDFLAAAVEVKPVVVEPVALAAVNS